MARGFAGFAPDPLAKEGCLCGSDLTYATCCGRLHRGQARAETAEQLMRSRYSAFAKGDVDYLMATHPDEHTPPGQRRRELRASCRQTRWLGLEILRVERGGVDDLEGTVSFEAHFQASGQRSSLREMSLFRRRAGDRNGDWLYIRPLN